MVTTSLYPYEERVLKVDVQTYGELDRRQKQEICYAVRRARTWTVNGFPSLDEVKQAIAEYDPELAKDMISIKYC